MRNPSIPSPNRAPSARPNRNYEGRRPDASSMASAPPKCGKSAAVVQASARTTRGGTSLGPETMGVARVPISSWSGEGQNACHQEAKIGRVWNSNKRRNFGVGFWRAFGGPQPARATQYPRRFAPPKFCEGRREVQASARTTRGGRH